MFSFKKNVKSKFFPFRPNKFEEKIAATPLQIHRFDLSDFNFDHVNVAKMKWNQ